MTEILLLGKKILVDQSPVLLSYQPDENWQEVWDAKGGSWEYKDGYLIGSEPENRGGILLSRQEFTDDVMISFTAKTVLPATRDLNALYCTEWDEETNYLKSGYICGLNGWYDHKSGIERFPENGLNATTTLYEYTPGTEVRICAGAINGHNFLVADGRLIVELIDPEPITGRHVGFSPYSTRLAVKDIEVRKIVWEPRKQRYQPEF